MRSSTRPSRRRSGLPVRLAAAAVAVALVGSLGAARRAAAQPPTLVIAQGADITTLDPTQATQIHNLNLFYNLYDALVTWDSKDIGKVVPELAVSWRSLNPTTWQFKLRQGVKFHNGEPFNAEAAKFTIDRLITKGVHQVYGGFATIERAEVVDPYTINVVTAKPDPILVKRFAGYGGQMLPPRYLKQVDWKEFALKPVGTGPYRFVEWIKDDRVVLEANPDYWRGVPRIKRVVWRPIPDNFARVAALVRGEAQLITKVIPDHVPEIEKAGCCRVEHTLTNLVTVYLINAQKGPLANAKVRQALNYAVDKDKIIKELYKGYAIPIGSGIPNTDFGYNPAIKPYPYDPARARKLLAEAGYASGVDIDIQSGNGIHLNDRQLTEAVAAMLADVGVRARVGVLEPAQRSQLLRTNTFPGLLLADPASTTYDTDGVLWRLHGPGGIVHKIWPGNYEGTRFYQLMEEARYSTDPEKRLRNYHEAAQIWHDEAVELFLFQGELIDAVRNEVVYRARGDQRILVNEISFR
jgi:peptide/nickel transport system substrate-binding protein